MVVRIGVSSGQSSEEFLVGNVGGLSYLLVFAPVLCYVLHDVTNSPGKTRVCTRRCDAIWFEWLSEGLHAFVVFAQVLCYVLLACHRDVTSSLGNIRICRETCGGNVRNDILRIWVFREDEEFEGASDGSLEWVGKSCSHPARSPGTFFIPHRSQRTASWRSCPAMQRCLNPRSCSMNYPHSVVNVDPWQPLPLQFDANFL